MKHLQKIIESHSAAFFDLDGTLVKTDYLHEKAYNLAAKKLGVSRSQVDNSELYKLKKEIYLDLISKVSIEVNTKVFSYYIDFLKNNKKVVIVTNTLEQNADTIINRFLIKPDLLIAGSSFADRIKPFPDMYESALEKLNLNFNEVIAFEDDKKGITSALSARIKVIDVIEEKIYEPL